MDELNNKKVQGHLPMSLYDEFKEWMKNQGVERESEGVRLAIALAVDKAAQVRPNEAELLRRYRLLDRASRRLVFDSAGVFVRAIDPKDVPESERE